MASATQTSSTVLHGGQEGQTSLVVSDGVYTVTDGQGNPVFEGDEVAAEFAFWRTELGVPDASVEVVSE